MSDRVRHGQRRLFLSCGEASGEWHGAALVRALRERDSSLCYSCLGGPLLAAEGASVVVENRTIALIGLVEVVRRHRQLLAAWNRIQRHLREVRPDLVVLVDFPDFNFFIGRLAHRLGIKVFYYIAPQVWAWRRGRVRSMRRFVDNMAVILPFEPDFYRPHGIAAHYVGHPLIDSLAAAPLREEAVLRYGAGTGVGSAPGRLLGLLPGSRQSEIRRFLPLLLQAARRLRELLPDLSFLVPLANDSERPWVERACCEWGVPVKIVSGDTHGVIRACELVLTVSGTVTLEAAVLGTPMIIFYRLSSLEAQLGRHLIKVRHIGLPNLIAGTTVCPELIQEQATPRRLADEAHRFLINPQQLERQRRDLARVRDQLGRPGVARRVARLVLDTLSS